MHWLAYFLPSYRILVILVYYGYPNLFVMILIKTNVQHEKFLPKHVLEGDFVY
jgi:hypothetical protein